MATLIYNSFYDDLARNNINPASDTFKVMLTTSAYTEDKDLHLKRSAITNEVTGTNYTAGGQTITATVTKDTVNDRLDIVFGAVTWAASDITARKAVVYKSRGGASTADELVCVIDFGTDKISASGNFTINAGMTIRIQN